MTLVGWLIFLLVVGVIFIVAELLLPTYAILGIIGAAMLVAAVVVSFVIDFWLGVGAMLGGGVAVPLGWAVFIKYWPRSPMGRQLILGPAQAERPVLAVHIGQTGQSISSLRPLGTCEFAGQRLEALSEYGIIEPGRPVKVVALNNRRPVVREVSASVG